MSGPISFDRFTNNIAGTSDNAVRFSKTTGDVTTAEHGFMSRAVRWISGPTKQDIQDNKQIINDFHKALATKFGPEIAQAALLHVRKDMEVRDGDGVFYRPDKALTQRQVKEALDYAQNAADGADHHTFMRALTNEVLRFSPGGSRFDEAALAKGVDPKGLDDEQQVFILRRLEQEVVREAQQDNRIPDRDEIRSMAGKLARQADREGSEWATGVNKRMEAATETGRAFIGAMAGDLDNPVGLLADLMRQGDELTPFMSTDGELGTDDRNKGALGGLREAVTSMKPEEARDLYEQIAKPGSDGRKLIAAFMRSEENVPGHDGPKVGSAGQVSQFMLATIQMIARRGGVEDSDNAVNKLMRSIERDADLAEDDDVVALSKGFDKLIDVRADFIREQAEIAMREDQEEYARQQQQQGTTSVT